jgi:hypothetical protein
MKDRPSFPPVPDRRLNDQDQNRARTLWYADGRSLNARVTKLDKDGIHFATTDASGFIEAAELCTADRVRYGFGTRLEAKWVERVTATLDKQKAALNTLKIAK